LVVNSSTTHLDAVFSALADPTRRAILAQLTQGASAITKLETPRKMSLPGVMKHLSVLENAGLVERDKKGRVVHCRLVAQPLQGASTWIEEYRRFWEQRLDSLADYLTEQKSKEFESC
jgi:DNA-binding transcriptional ArsR family regulator